MSASNKKKLRKEQESVKLTEKQLTAQKEAKKLKLYTAISIQNQSNWLITVIFFKSF